jgi:hypothetical protein
MNNQPRAAVTLIVEGHGEYNHLPRMIPLATKDWINIPRPIRAKGWGDVVCRLEEHLTDQVKAHHPYTVIVVLDKKDALDPKNGFDGCIAGMRQIQKAINNWYEKARSSGKLDPLPDGVVVIPACQKFESWIMADCDGLKSCSFINADVCHHDCANVDAEIPDPATWIINRCKNKTDIKHQPNVARMIACIDMKIVRERSKSFDKLCVKAELAYQRWAADQSG